MIVRRTELATPSCCRHWLRLLLLTTTTSSTLLLLALSRHCYALEFVEVTSHDTSESKSDLLLIFDDHRVNKGDTSKMTTSSLPQSDRYSNHPRSKTSSTSINRSLQLFTSTSNSASATEKDDVAVGTTSPRAVVSDQIILKKKARLRRFLKNLRNKPTKRVILGQQGNHNNTDLSSSYATGFDFV
jgi:hypothetical protein